MEDGLRDELGYEQGEIWNVLILVLVEDGLRVFNLMSITSISILVLILVLVEDGLRVMLKNWQLLTGLNPCSCG